MGDDDFIMEEFEWALKDPTEEKLRGLGEVVSTITHKLVEAIGVLEGNISSLQNQVNSLESKISSLESRIARGVTPTPAEGGPSLAAEAAPSIAKAPVSAAPKPVSPGGGMMGELKALLAARRKRSETEQE
ncbi:MAG: hypothetical protein QXS20_01620 [Candidatus Thorarchaeota archaeon]